MLSSFYRNLVEPKWKACILTYPVPTTGLSLQPNYIRINYHTLTLKMEAARSSETLFIYR